MLSIQLFGAKELAASVRKISKQIPFAASKAINATAIKVQDHEVTQELPDHLKIRSQWFRPRTKYGVNISFSSKRKLVAVVGSQAPWLALVEKGGTKLPPKKAIPIPTSNIDTSRRRKRTEKPSVLLSRRGAFVATMKSGKSGIFMRVGKSRYPIKSLYLFEDKAQIPDILNFFQAGKRVVDKNFISIFADEFRKAVASAK